MLSVYEKYELCISGFLKIALKLLKKKSIHPKFTMRFSQIVRLAGYHSYMYYVKYTVLQITDYVTNILRCLLTIYLSTCI